MKDEALSCEDRGVVSRRAALRTIGAAAGVFAFAADSRSQTAPAPNAALSTSPSVISHPPREFGPNATPMTYPDPDVIVIDPEFNRLRAGNAALQRLFTGAMFSEGPAWSSQGRYLVWSDVPGDRQYRYLEDDGRVTVFRQPTNNSNGNTFDFQGRQVSCEHRGRRVVRYENDGSVTVIAEFYKGKHLNSPNDVTAHPDGSYWLTDPPFGNSLYQGVPDAPGGMRTQNDKLNNKLGYPAGMGLLKGELSGNVYRADPSGRVDQVLSQEDLGGPPNGIAFSPDYKKLYVIGRGMVFSFDVADGGKSIRNQKQFTDCMVDGIRCGPDGMRVDIEGNVWVSSNAGANIGYSGVTVWNSQGKLIGRIRLPESCANLAFGGAKRNRLFMTASQSLYAIYLETQGAAPG